MPQQSGRTAVVIVTEEGAQRRRAGQADPHRHVDGHDGRRTPGARAQHVENPEDREQGSTVLLVDQLIGDLTTTDSLKTSGPVSTQLN